MPIPTKVPLQWTTATDSAPPICRMVRREAQSDGNRNDVRYNPVGFSAGVAGGSSAHGICTLV